jgi:hypothetical protein
LPPEVVESLPSWATVEMAEEADEWMLGRWTHKTCAHCHQSKLKATGFHRMASMQDGFRPTCRECRARERREALGGDEPGPALITWI